MIIPSKHSILILVSVLIFCLNVFAVFMFFIHEDFYKNSFIVKIIYVSDTKYTDRDLIENLVKNVQYKNIFNVDVDYLKNELSKLPFIRNVKVLKKYPNEIIIKIYEKNIKYINTDGYLLDENLNIIKDKIRNEDLYHLFIVLSGDPNKDKVDRLFTVLNKFPLISKNIVSAELISNRRWNVTVKIYGKNIIFKLPESDIDLKINDFFRKVYKTNFFLNYIPIIDLRSDKIILYK